MHFVSHGIMFKVGVCVHELSSTLVEKHLNGNNVFAIETPYTLQFCRYIRALNAAAPGLDISIRIGAYLLPVYKPIKKNSFPWGRKADVVGLSLISFIE